MIISAVNSRCSHPLLAIPGRCFQSRRQMIVINIVENEQLQSVPHITQPIRLKLSDVSLGIFQPKDLDLTGVLPIVLLDSCQSSGIDLDYPCPCSCIW